jgi:hypothetical protein
VEEIEPPADEEDEKNVTGQPILTLPESTTVTSTGTNRGRTASPPRRGRAKRPPASQ